MGPLYFDRRRVAVLDRGCECLAPRIAGRAGAMGRIQSATCYGAQRAMFTLGSAIQKFATCEHLWRGRPAQAARRNGICASTLHHEHPQDELRVRHAAQAHHHGTVALTRVAGRNITKGRDWDTHPTRRGALGRTSADDELTAPTGREPAGSGAGTPSPAHVTTEDNGRPRRNEATGRQRPCGTEKDTKYMTKLLGSEGAAGDWDIAMGKERG